MKSHPAADFFPVLTDKAYESFKADIAKNGLRELIVTCDGMILDGRNRYRACNELGIKPKYWEYKDDSPIAFAWSLNRERRHLNKSQLANVGVKMLPALKEEAKKRQQLSQGRGKKGTGVLPELKGEAVEHAGKVVGVSGSSVQHAKFVAENDPELSKKIDAGEITLNAAYKKLKEKQKQPATKEARITAIRKMAKEGHNADQIAEKIGISVKWTRVLAKENSITLTDAQIGRVRKINAHRVIQTTVDGLEGYALGLQTINGVWNGIDADEALEWASSLAESLKSINRLRKKLLEIANGK